MNDVRIPIYIRKEIYERIKKEVDINQGKFKNIEEYVEFVLEELLKEEESEYIYSKEEEEKIKKRLRELGYVE